MNSMPIIRDLVWSRYYFPNTSITLGVLNTCFSTVTNFNCVISFHVINYCACSFQWNKLSLGISPNLRDPCLEWTGLRRMAKESNATEMTTWINTEKLKSSFVTSNELLKLQGEVSNLSIYVLDPKSLHSSSLLLMWSVLTFPGLSSIRL